MELQFAKDDRVLDYLYGQNHTDGRPGPGHSLLLRETQPRYHPQIVSKMGVMCMFSKSYSAYIPMQTNSDAHVPWPVMILLDAVHGITGVCFCWLLLCFVYVSRGCHNGLTTCFLLPLQIT